MISLFIDTCTSNLIIAILKEKEVIKKMVEVNNKNLSTDFTFFVDKILKESNIEIEQIEKIFVSIGPGSFTGIRIGLTFAKVLSWSLKIPVVPVSSLEVIVSGMEGEVLVPILNARRGYVYAGIYDNNMDNIMTDRYILLEELNQKLKSYSLVTYISCDDFDFSVVKPTYKIENIIGKYYENSGVNPHSLVPCYLKKTEAEEKLGDIKC